MKFYIVETNKPSPERVAELQLGIQRALERSLAKKKKEEKMNGPLRNQSTPAHDIGSPAD